MRRLLALAVVAGLVVSFACGDDDADPGDPTGESTPGTATLDPFATKTPPPPRPSPTPANDDGEVLSVFAPQARLTLTMAEIREMATSTVEGFDEEGVTLEALASKVAFTGDTTITFRGYRDGAGTQQFALGRYSELAPTTILYINDEGQLGLKSGGIEEAFWLKVVDQITFE